MQSRKTHDQQMRIIEKRDNTANGGKDLDVEADLKRSGAAKAAMRKGQGIKTHSASEDDDGMTLGNLQESAHHKRVGRA
jgi:hypothetical protein